MLSIRLLGPPQLERDGQPVSLDTRKAIALLAYLALTGETHARDHLATLLWPELDQSRARAALRRTLSALRSGVGEGALLITRESIGLEQDSFAGVDVVQFEGLLTRGGVRNHRPGQDCAGALKPLKDAVNLYRGGFLDGFTLRDSPAFDDWQFFEADRLRRDFSTALEHLASCHLQTGEYDLAIEITHRWLSLDPLHEPAHRQLMRLYAGAGQRHAALRQYRECVRIFEDELGVPPLPETTQLYENILENRIAVGDRDREAHKTEPLSQPQPAISRSSHPMVGRNEEWSTLTEVFAHCRENGHFMIIEGEVGVGKTRLAEEFVDHASAQKSIVLSARCYQGEHSLAYAPVIEALRSVFSHPVANEVFKIVPTIWTAEAQRLLPELAALVPDLPPAPHGEGPAAQSRLFEALRKVIEGLAKRAAPGVLFIDDLQWADSASLDLLAYIVHRLKGLPLLIVGVWRTEDVLPGHPLRAVMAQAERQRHGTNLTLGRLSPEEVSELAGFFDSVPVSLQQRLYLETEGLPFFVVEYLNAGNDLALGVEIPKSVREIQQARLARVGESEQQLLTTAAVIGRSFDFDTLRATSGRSEEETVTAIEGLVARGLLLERINADSQPKDRLSSSIEPEYDFTHEKLRSVVYEQASLARRRLLHRRVAQHLVVQSRTLGVNAAVVAHHFQLSGREEEAADYFKLAGEQACKVYANAEALTHFRAALALGHPDASGLHEAIGDLQTLGGKYRDAVTSYEVAAALAELENLPGLEHKLGDLHHRRGDFDLAVSHFRAALDLLEKNELTLAVKIYADWSRSAARLGDHEEARRLAEDALGAAVQSSTIDKQISKINADPMAQVLNILGILDRQAGDTAGAQAHLEKALEAARNNPAAQVAALNNLALVLRDMGDFEKAVSFTKEALALCVRLGDRHREAALYNHLADLHHAKGDAESAMGYLKKAVEIFAEIGVDAGEYEPEIWKLTEW